MLARALTIVDCAQVTQTGVDSAKHARIAKCNEQQLPALELTFQPWDASAEGDDNPWPPGVGTGW